MSSSTKCTQLPTTHDVVAELHAANPQLDINKVIALHNLFTFYILELQKKLFVVHVRVMLQYNFYYIPISSSSN